MPLPPLARVLVGKTKTIVAVGFLVGEVIIVVAEGCNVSITANVAAVVRVGRNVDVIFSVGELAILV